MEEREISAAIDKRLTERFRDSKQRAAFLARLGSSLGNTARSAGIHGVAKSISSGRKSPANVVRQARRINKKMNVRLNRIVAKRGFGTMFAKFRGRGAKMVYGTGMILNRARREIRSDARKRGLRPRGFVPKKTNIGG